MLKMLNHPLGEVSDHARTGCEKCSTLSDHARSESEKVSFTPTKPFADTELPVAQFQRIVSNLAAFEGETRFVRNYSRSLLLEASYALWYTKLYSVGIVNNYCSIHNLFMMIADVRPAIGDYGFMGGGMKLGRNFVVSRGTRRQFEQHERELYISLHV